MKKSLGLAFLVLALIHCGASAPRQADVGSSAENSKKINRSNASVSPQGFVAYQIMKMFGRTPGKIPVVNKKNSYQKGGLVPSLGNEKTSGSFQLPPKSMTSPATNVTKVPQFEGMKSLRLSQDAKASKDSALFGSHEGVKARKVKQMVLSSPPVPLMAVPQIRQEIQKILDLNKQIKNVQSGRVGQFQRVQEQARLHQKILNDLESAKQEANNRKMPQREDLLAQEKLRIIHEETLRNAKLLEAARSEYMTASAKDSVNSGAESISAPKPGPRNS